MQRKKILLLAYTNVNFGDDMFIKTICDFFPNYQFTLEAPRLYQCIFANTNNLAIIPNDNLLYKLFRRADFLLGKFLFHSRRVFRALWLQQFDAVVYVIGGLFDEDELWHNRVTRLGQTAEKQRIWRDSNIKNIPFYLLGSNMTRIKTDYYKQVMKYCFQDLHDICFRDRFSYNAFCELENVRYAPDIVFNYTCATEKTRKNEVVISVWGVLTRCEQFPQWVWAEDLWASYESFICQAAEYFLSQGMHVCLLSLCENEGDLQGCHIIKNRLNRDSVRVVSYNGNIDQTVALFEEAAFVVGTRFHSVVMALNAGTPFYPVVYESKTMQLLKDVGYTSDFSHINMMSPPNEMDKLIKVFQQTKVVDCTEIKRMAKSQFENL